MYNAFKLVSLAVVTLTASGCMSPPVKWQYSVSEGSFDSSENSLLVEAVEDKRVLRNETKSMLSALPFVLWTTENDQAFDLNLAREGTKYQSTPVGELRFVATQNLLLSTAKELGHSRFFAPVFSHPSEVGPWKSDGSQHYTLKLMLNKLGFKKSHYSYGLGPCSFLLNAVGAPQKNVELDINWDLIVYNEDRKPVYKDSIVQRASFYDGWYYNLDAEQRALDEISFALHTSLQKLQQELSQ